MFFSVNPHDSDDEEDEDDPALSALSLRSGDRKAGRVVVVAATNRLEDLDEAVLRRFEAKIYVGEHTTSHRNVYCICYTMLGLE
jgi:SpoVK/Ycf46/Vps4 family AAA+-type ATPase